jgi:hypothetical protein
MGRRIKPLTRLDILPTLSCVLAYIVRAVYFVAVRSFCVMLTGSVAPVALFYNLANRFHNGPSFFLNDYIVRRRDNITGFGSGVKVTAKV